MKLRWKYVFLVLALTELAIAFGGLRPNMFVNLGLPLGLMLFGLFLITQILEGESALLAEQNRAAALPQNEPIRTAMPSQNSRNEVATHPVPTFAHTH
jgi:hypothetical protein